MATLTTTRLGLPSPDGDEPVAVPADIRALALAIDNAAIIDAGPESNRDESSPSVPGLAGRWYWSTDTEVLAFDYGTGWLTVWPQGAGPLSIKAEHLDDDAVITRTIADVAVTAAKIAAAAVETAKLANGAVTAQKLASALKPSEGASAETEALRALGTQAGRAAPGTHASQHAPGGADRLYAGGSGSAMTDSVGVLTVTGTHSFGTVPTIADLKLVGADHAPAGAPWIVSATTSTVTLAIWRNTPNTLLSYQWAAWR